MSGLKGDFKVGVVSRREVVEKARSSSSRREGAKKMGSSSNTEDPVPKASLMKNREEKQESELIIVGRRGAYQTGLTASEYRHQWESDWSGRFGCFEDTSESLLR